MLGEQRTDEWRENRLGKITASECHAIAGFAKKPKDAGKTYLYTKTSERLKGAEDDFDTPAMAWGREHEEAARQAYEVATGRKTVQGSFVMKTVGERLVGASPDALVISDADIWSYDFGVEIKCPYKTANHFALADGKLKPQYVAQMQMGMYVLGMDRWDFVSYDPRLPEDIQLFYATIEADKDWQVQFETDAVAFYTAMDDLIETLRKRK